MCDPQERSYQISQTRVFNNLQFTIVLLKIVFHTKSSYLDSIICI